MQNPKTKPSRSPSAGTRTFTTDLVPLETAADAVRTRLASDLVYEHEAAHAVLAWLLFGDSGETKIDEGGGTGRYAGRRRTVLSRAQLVGAPGHWTAEIPAWALGAIEALGGRAAEDVRLAEEGFAPAWFVEPISARDARDTLAEANDPESFADADDDLTAVLLRCRCVAWASGRRRSNYQAIARICNALVDATRRLVVRPDVCAGLTAMAARLRATDHVDAHEMRGLLSPLVVPLRGPHEDHVHALGLARTCGMESATWLRWKREAQHGADVRRATPRSSGVRNVDR